MSELHLDVRQLGYNGECSFTNCSLLFYNRPTHAWRGVNMKVLYYLRHSIKDAENNISSEGIELAKSQGRAFFGSHIVLNASFVGPLVRTQQTWRAFFQGHTIVPTMFQEPIEYIGTEELLKEISTNAFKSAVKSGKSLFEAVLEVHPTRVESWKHHAFAGVQLMFDEMKDREVAVAFGHSPMIELAAYAIEDNDLHSEFRRLGEMEGIAFAENDPNVIARKLVGISVATRIPRPQAQAPAATIPEK